MARDALSHRVTEGASGHLADVARPCLDRRLGRNAAAPLVVAFSGGGDSLALLIAAKAWADGAGRRLLAVTVDHRLQAAGAAWAAWCEARARRLGVGHRVLIWTGDKPGAGLAAAARRARHGLIAEAARAAGARVILMGHTADDRLEARLMRAEGGAVPEPREWSPSPVWPEGREIFILRPLIETRRACLRRGLATAGETWIDDPANVDMRLPRARARAALAAGGEAGPGASAQNGASLLGHVIEGAAGDLTVAREALRRAPADASRALIGAALLSVAGTARPPRGERLDRLIGRLVGREDFVATLAGARIEAGDPWVRVQREAGDRRRGGGVAMGLPAGATAVWDGRFEIEARTGGLAVAALGGLAGRLDRADRGALKAVPPAARPGLPAVIDGLGRVTCPRVVADPRLAIRSLIFARLAGAVGGFDSEAAMSRVAETLATP